MRQCIRGGTQAGPRPNGETGPTRLRLPHEDSTWLHIASTALLTFYRVCAKRGSLLMNVAGIVVHDHWKPYYTIVFYYPALREIFSGQRAEQASRQSQSAADKHESADPRAVLHGRVDAVGKRRPRLRSAGGTSAIVCTMFGDDERLRLGQIEHL